MTLELINKSSESGGAVAANQRATETFSGTINGKHFVVVFDSCDAPRWSGDALNDDEKDEVKDEAALLGCVRRLQGEWK